MAKARLDVRRPIVCGNCLDKTTMLSWPLNTDERLLWQGRPAPRCYLFRHWPGQIACFFALVVSLFMLLKSFQQESPSGVSILWVLLTLLLLAFGPLRLILLRRRWETIFYAVTSRRVLILRGKKQEVDTYPLARLQTVNIYRFTSKLADIELLFAGSCKIVLECLEEPDNCLCVLPVSADAT